MVERKQIQGCNKLNSDWATTNNLLLSIESWLFHRDPYNYNGLWKNPPYICVVSHPQQIP